MTRRRWIADEVAGDCAALTGSHAEHLVRVLRARVGQEFDIATPGAVRKGRISGIQDQRVEFELNETLADAALPRIILALSIFKFDRMEWAIEKCTELGVGSIIPVASARTDAHLAAAAVRRIERWSRVALQASEQCRRAAAPEITAPRKTPDVVALTASTRVLLSETGNRERLTDAIQDHPPGGDLLLSVGPEGGWTDAEHTLYRNAGWSVVTLGPTILRAETAAIAAVSIVMAELQ